jgi:hypothetical protein
VLVGHAFQFRAGTAGHPGLQGAPQQRPVPRRAGRVDAYWAAPNPAATIPKQGPPGRFKYGGGHVIEDLLRGKAVRLWCESYVTDCYPRNPWKKTSPWPAQDRRPLESAQLLPELQRGGEPHQPDHLHLHGAAQARGQKRQLRHVRRPKPPFQRPLFPDHRPGHENIPRRRGGLRARTWDPARPQTQAHRARHPPDRGRHAHAQGRASGHEPQIPAGGEHPGLRLLPGRGRGHSHPHPQRGPGLFHRGFGRGHPHAVKDTATTTPRASDAPWPR